MNYSDLIDLINRNVFNGVKINIKEHITGEYSKGKGKSLNTDSLSITFIAEIERLNNNDKIYFKKKYVMLDNNDDFNSFSVIMSNKFKKDFIENYFTKGILNEK